MTRFPIVCLVLLVACDGGEADPVPLGQPLTENTQIVTVNTCFSINLPDDMLQVDVQPIDSIAGRWNSSNLVFSYDCGVYDTNYAVPATSESSIVIEGKSATLSRYDVAGIYDGLAYNHILALRIQVPSDNALTGAFYLNLAVFVPGEEDLEVANSILASLQNVFAD